jgi:hypothetical protein
VEGVPPSTIPNIVCPLAKGVTDPAVSVPDASQLPLTLLDPLHKKIHFSSVPKNREDRRQRVSAQVESSVSGFPLPVSSRHAIPEPEIVTGFSSQATTSNQSTNLLLQQLMAEMKYLFPLNSWRLAP